MATLKIDKARCIVYDKHGTAIYGRRLALPGREVMLMVTYDALFAYSLVIIGVIGLVIQIYKRK